MPAPDTLECRPLRIAGIEMGGTKCVCLLGSGPGALEETVRIPTTTPDETMAAIDTVLARWQQDGAGFEALGVAAFGPLDLDTSSPGYGSITTTSKHGWRDTPVALRLKERFGVPVGITTDTIGAALAEGRWGAGVGLRDFVYITVGTGVGAGVIVNGQPALGLNHPELGHLRIPRLAGDAWPGSCPYHGDCVEGLASGSAITARLGRAGDAVGSDDPVWDSVAHALAMMLHAVVLTTVPQKIIMGGGVMSAQPHLFARIADRLRNSLAGYVAAPAIAEGLERYIVPPGLGPMAGPLGAVAVALDALCAGRS